MSTVKVEVLRSVLVADGTLYGRQIVAGLCDEVPHHLFDGLKNEGYVQALKSKKGGGKTESLLTKMDTATLTALATEKQIDISSATTDEDIVALIEAAA